MNSSLRSGTNALKTLGANIEAHKGRKGQPAVLVRLRAGSTVEIFHSAQDPCGLGHYVETLTGSAHRDGCPRLRRRQGGVLSNA